MSIPSTNSVPLAPTKSVNGLSMKRLAPHLTCTPLSSAAQSKHILNGTSTETLAAKLNVNSLNLEHSEKQQPMFKNIRKNLAKATCGHYGCNPLSCTEQLTIDERETLKEFGINITEDCELERVFDQPSQKKVSIRESLFDYCWDHQIVDMSQLYKRPGPEVRPFFMMNQFGTFAAAAFKAVKAMLAFRPFEQAHKFPHYSDFVFNFDIDHEDIPSIPVGIANLLRDAEFLKKYSRIYRYLTVTCEWDDMRVKRFANCLLRVFNRTNGKKNALALIGPSNSGKSQIIRSFLDCYAYGIRSSPSNKPRDTFQWASCVNARCILWEEPNISNDNIEEVKLLLAGDPCSIEVKYQDAQFIEQTPFFITSNRELHHWVQTSSEEMNNRIEKFYLRHKGSDKHPFPLNNLDWYKFMTVCNSELRTSFINIPPKSYETFEESTDINSHLFDVVEYSPTEPPPQAEEKTGDMTNNDME